MILRAFVGSRQRPQHFIIFLFGSRVPEREILGYLFPPPGVEVAGANGSRRNGSCFLCGNEAFAGVYSRGGVGGCPVGLEGVQGKRGANTGTVGGVGGS